MTGPERSTGSSGTASTSAVPSRPLCAICNHQYAIYTCPRCHTRTCSLPCSTHHKSSLKCTGERDRVKHVNMNEYGWGTMMNDYVFLEEVGRKIGEWGREIGKSGLMPPPGRGRGRGYVRGTRGGRAHGNRNGNGSGKKEMLRMRLAELLDVEMEVLPSGMQRSKQNQSMWNPKTKTAWLTVEFRIHSSDLSTLAYTVLTHRNAFDIPLLTILQSHLKERDRSTKKETSNPKAPDWVLNLALPNSDDPESFQAPEIFMMCTLLDPVLNPIQGGRAFRRLDPRQSLDSILRNSHFVEFPAFEVWESGAFRGTLVDGQGSMLNDGVGEERRPKRRRLNVQAGKKALHGLLGGYGSSDEEEAGEVKNVLDLLGSYPGSDEDERDNSDGKADRSQAHPPGAEMETEDSEDETDIDEASVALDPAALLELVQRIPGIVEDADGEEIDWGDSDSADEH